MAGDARGDLEFVDVRLWAADAMVLFDWLLRADLDEIPLEDPSQRQSLAALLGQLGSILDLPSRDELADARVQVLRHTG